MPLGQIGGSDRGPTIIPYTHTRKIYSKNPKYVRNQKITQIPINPENPMEFE